MNTSFTNLLAVGTTATATDQEDTVVAIKSTDENYEIKSQNSHTNLGTIKENMNLSDELQR